ncbi:hypothetical protein GmHk_04G010100 [Glycine max]|nr:hypothetical protein GmHk_04G010100 [Glycine max]
MKILLILKEGNEKQFEGTKEFNIASNKRDLFLRFSEHQEWLRKKFALEEGRIFAANEQVS